MWPGLVMFALAGSLAFTWSDTFDRWSMHPARWRWGIGIAAAVWLIAGLTFNHTDCVTDWDGRSNLIVCG